MNYKEDIFKKLEIPTAKERQRVLKKAGNFKNITQKSHGRSELTYSFNARPPSKK